MMKKYTLIITMVLSVFLPSCDDWLDVTPSNEIRLEDQVQTARGFIELLNGVYITMAQEELYGQHLMYGDIEFLAQNHHPDGVLTNNNNGFAEYDYTDNQAITRYEAYWSGLYNAIANVNAILDHVDDKVDLFAEDDYNLVKGEALALRAFLHFDVLRLFGERYSDETKEKIQMPYYKSVDLARYDHKSAEFIYIDILNDLNQAEELLAQSDPVAVNYGGVLFSEDERILHLNYFALLALKARVYITRGDNTEHQDYADAQAYAQQLITGLDWSWSTKPPEDVLLSGELLWALNVTNLPLLYQETFGTRIGYTLANQDYNGATRIFDVDNNGAFDIRYLYQLSSDEDAVFSNSISIKYSGIEESDFDVVPMFRMSEVWLMATETLLEVDREGAIDMLNEIKQERDVLIPDPNYTGLFNAEILNMIIEEYRKELLMEGQTFFLYKRLDRQEIPDAISIDGVIEMTPEDYVLPLPYDENLLANTGNG